MDRCSADAKLLGDLPAGRALSAQEFNLCSGRNRDLSWTVARPARTVLQSANTTLQVPSHPLPDSRRADNKGNRGLLRRQAFNQYLSGERLSTMRCQSCILVDVHSLLLGLLKLPIFSFQGQERVDNLLRLHS